MDSISLVQLHLQLAHEVLEGTMADVTDEQAHWLPPGIATPLGASYAHVVLYEDMVINRMLKHELPLSATIYADRIGVSEDQPIPGLEWVNYAEWTRSVHIDLSQARTYAQAVYKNSQAYLASLKPEDLDRELDLTAFGMGRRSLAWVLGMLVIGHANNIAGEISCLKGLQGAKGYPF